MSARSFKRAHARRVAREERRLRVLGRRGRVVGATLGASALFAASAQAATYTVTTNGDDAPGGTCSGTTCTTLRDALSVANGDSTPDTIMFAPSVTGTITLMNGALPMTNSYGITINGPGAGSLAISGNNASQVFTVSGAAASSGSPADAINGLTLENGSTSSQGGAVQQLSSRPLTLSGDVVTGSTTSSATGGGGIYSDGTLTVSNSTVSGDTAPSGSGGGIKMAGGTRGTLTVNASVVSGNSALNGGGIAGFVGSGPKYTPPNVAQISGGTLITGNHATGGSGGGIGGAFGELSVSRTAVSGNTATGSGGGIFSPSKYSTSISGSAIAGNSAASGGGVDVTASRAKYAPEFSPVKIATTTISGNHATSDGAGVNVEQISSGNEVSIVASTLTGNQGGSGSFGGGLEAVGHVYGTLLLSDSTVSGNSAASGGGVGLGDASHGQLIGTTSGGSGQILLDNSTIASNAASTDGGGVYLGQYGSAPVQSGIASLRSTIVSGNSAHGSPQDLARAAGSTSGGFNSAFSLIENPGSAPMPSKQSVITGQDPQLGPLANNGGPTQTMLPAGTSPVVDQGRAFDDLSTDQRGQPRTVNTPIPNPPGGDGTDIGSLELPAASVVGIKFQVLINGDTLGGPKRPLIAGHHTPIRCTVRLSTISACTIKVTAGNKVVARGSSSTTTPHGQIFLRVFLTQQGRKLLAKHPLGLDGVAYAVGTAPGAPSVSGNVHLLAGPKFVLGARDTSSLSKHVKHQLDRIATLLAGVSRVTCTAHTHAGKAVAKAEARAACGRLKNDGLSASYKTSGRGHTTGKNRLVVSFEF